MAYPLNVAVDAVAIGVPVQLSMGSFLLDVPTWSVSLTVSGSFLPVLLMVPIMSVLAFCCKICSTCGPVAETEENEAVSDDTFWVSATGRTYHTSRSCRFVESDSLSCCCCCASRAVDKRMRKVRLCKHCAKIKRG